MLPSGGPPADGIAGHEVTTGVARVYRSSRSRGAGRSTSQLGPTTPAPASRQRSLRARSGETENYRLGAGHGEGDEGIVSLTRRVDDHHVVVGAFRNAPSARTCRTITTGPGRLDGAAAVRSSSTKRLVAFARSCHQPFGREPTTFAVSMSNTSGEGSHNAVGTAAHHPEPRSSGRDCDGGHRHHQ